MPSVIDWSFLVGPSAGHSHHASLLASNVSLSDCLAACVTAGPEACTAAEYIHRYIKPAPTKHADSVEDSEDEEEALGTTARSSKSVYPTCDHSQVLPRRNCYAVHASGFHRPCEQADVESVLALRREGRTPAPGARSVLMVIFDDLRVMDTELGAKFMPVARAFAASATTFLSAHAQTALCAPSRASFLSGRRPDLTRVHWTDAHLRQHLPAREWVTMPQHFRGHGYYVAAAGKMFHKMADPLSTDPQSWSEPDCIAGYPYFGQGSCPEKPDVLLRVFNTSVVSLGDPNSQHLPCHVTCPQPHCILRSTCLHDQTACACALMVRVFFVQGCPVETARHPGYVFTDKLVLHKALAQLRAAAPRARAGTQPFWLGVGFFKPHKPYVFPAELLRYVPPLLETPLPSNDLPPHGMAPMANLPELCTARGPKSPEAQRGSRCARENVRMYHAAAAFTDSLLGELLDELERQKMRANTLVAVLGDHGFALGEHGSWAKWTNWEVATRVPFALRVPWLPLSVGRRISEVVELLDLFPTLAELAGVPLELQSSRARPDYAGVNGRSLAKLFEQPLRALSDGSEDAAFSQIARCWPSGVQHDATSFAAMAQCDGIPLSDYAFMGYSMRTATARYTEWVPVRWDGSTQRLMPQWAQTVTVELYEHANDVDFAEHWAQASENANLAPERPAECAILRRRLQEHFDRTLEEARASAWRV